MSITRLWLFPRLGPVDSWTYFGYFIHPARLLNTGYHYFFSPFINPDTAKLFSPKEVMYPDSRLPWTMVGALIYHLFPPLVANYVLHLSFYYATILSVYGALKYTVGKRSGLIAAVLLGTYGYFIVSQNWDYVEVAVLAYFSLTVFFLTLAIQVKWWRLALFGAGYCYGSMIFSNTVAVFLTPALTTYYFLSNYRYRKHPLLASIGYSVLGLVGVTLFFGAISKVITGNLFFFMPAVRFIFASTKDGYGYSPPGWVVSLNEHQWMWLPFLISCTSFICIVWSSIQSQHKGTLVHSLPIFSVTFLLCVLPSIFLELKGQGVLRIVYYASYLIPPMFLALGEQVSLVLERLNQQIAGSLIAGIVILQIFTFRQLLYRMVGQGFSYSAALVDVQNLMHGTYALVIAVIVVLLGLRLILKGNTTKYKRWVSAKLILVLTLLGFYYCFNFQALFTLFSSGNGAWNRLFYSSIPEDSMLATIQAQNILKEIDPKGQFLFWFNDEPEFQMYSMVFSSSAATFRLIGREFPSINFIKGTPNSEVRTQDLKFQFDKSPKVVLLSQKSNVVQQANAALSSIGFTSNLVSSYDIAQGDIRFKMTIIEVSKKSLP
ncbi:hypothetical protein JOY44_04205 [Phormidium sp. CLA17]|uniref:hypothetical protein n=1 Tax=Leptolyngbya sp. Cla-17 TaxID=2803751 RepID=UPI001491C583|nr:hypothetical protein [Leptolyngbya sp. Cla-17]MBM0740825.1 hypothetical protein [Leptolyngbya sp. Cla-17]